MTSVLAARMPSSVVVALTTAMVLATADAGWAQGRAPAVAPEVAVRDYRSPHFLIHTDLPPEKVRELLGRLEVMLKLISTYWAQPLSGGIECYVVDDLANFANVPLPDRAVASIKSGAGVTLSTKVSSGNRFLCKAIVYSCSRFGVVQHEAVHAYCHQTFGRVGPTWYAEGMAEMGQYWREGESAVQIDPHVLKYLQSSPPQSLRELVDPKHYTGDSWQNYAWRWALCHLLANNPNYARRFRPLGLAILAGRDVSFEQVYGPVAREISMEYLLFLKHIDQGYRVDLCALNWKQKFLAPKDDRTRKTRVEAKAGWQPSGVTVASGRTYQYATRGTWQTAKEFEPVGADGGADGVGRLTAILMHDYAFGEPFALGSSGTFSAPADGDLWLRCADRWNALADNDGTIDVALRLVEK